jgi:hypothetical protein
MTEELRFFYISTQIYISYGTFKVIFKSGAGKRRLSAKFFPLVSEMSLFVHHAALHS